MHRWFRQGLQNLYSSVRYRPAPPTDSRSSWQAPLTRGLLHRVPFAGLALRALPLKTRPWPLTHTTGAHQSLPGQRSDIGIYVGFGWVEVFTMERPEER